MTMTELAVTLAAGFGLALFGMILLYVTGFLLRLMALLILLLRRNHW